MAEQLIEILDNSKGAVSTGEMPVLRGSYCLQHEYRPWLMCIYRGNVGTALKCRGSGAAQHHRTLYLPVKCRYCVEVHKSRRAAPCRCRVSTGEMPVLRGSVWNDEQHYLNSKVSTGEMPVLRGSVMLLAKALDARLHIYRGNAGTALK